MRRHRVSIIHIHFIVLTALFIFSLNTAPNAQEENFKWQDASNELDALAFSQSFIDSVKNEHLGVKSSGSPRRSGKSPWGKETLIYEVQWGPMKAGFMILTAEPDPASGQIRLGMKMISNNFVSSIYRIRDYSITWVDAKEFYPTFFEQHTREKKYRKDEYIIYDNKREKIIVGRATNKKNEVTEIEAPPFTHNFVSALYYARTMDLSAGGSFSINMYTRPNVHPMRMRVRKEERVSVGNKKYRSLMIEPTLAGDGERFNKNDHMTVWIAQDDEHRVPVMAKSKLKFGSVTARLVQVIRTE